MEIQLPGLLSIAMDDYSALHRKIFMLAYGKPLRDHNNLHLSDDNDANPRRNTLICTTFACTDMIRDVRMTSPGFVKQVVTSQLRAYSVSKSVLSILNEMGITLSYETGRRQTLKDHAAKLEKGLDDLRKIGRHDCAALLCDNFGYKKGGGFDKVGYMQMTMLIHVVLRKEKLQEWEDSNGNSIYPKDESRPNENVLSREANCDWAADCLDEEKTSYEKVMAVTADDRNNLGDCVFSLAD